MNTLFVNLIEQTVPISALIALLLAVSPLIKKSFVAKWRYFMWLFVSVKLILPFKLNIFGAAVTMEVPNRISGIPVMSESTASTAAVSVSAFTAGGVSLQSILMLIWLAGAVIFAAYQIAVYLRFKHTVRRWGNPIFEGEIKDTAEKIMKELGETRDIDIIICRAVSTPMVFGFIKPRLILPDVNYTDAELKVILYHELIHFKHNDIWYKLVLLTANVLNWFNPLVYIMANAANKDIELVCDGEVVKGQDMDFRCDYCRLILNGVHGAKTVKMPLSTCFVFSKKVIRERFGGILDLKEKRRGVWLFVIVALSVAVSGSLVSFAAEKSADILEEDLKIIERPAEEAETPRTPEPTENVYADAEEHMPAITDAPGAEGYGGIYETAETAEEIGTEQYDADITGGTEEIYADTAAESETDENSINLNENSSRLYINFNGADEVYTSSNVYVADEGTEMVVASSGNMLVQVVDNGTGEIVSEQNADEGSPIIVPSGEYSITAVSTEESSENTEDASIYVYGREREQFN